MRLTLSSPGTARERRVRLCVVASALAVAALAQPASSAGAADAPVRFTELSRRVVETPAARTAYVRVLPPNLPAPSASAGPTSVAADGATAEEAALEARRAGKTMEPLALVATVYLGAPPVTELTLWRGGRAWRAWSTVDFRHLTQLAEIETDTHVFTWLPIVVAVPAQEADEATGGEAWATASRWPASWAAAEADYFFEEGPCAGEAVAAVRAALDRVHALYRWHGAHLAADFARREGEARERERQRATAPPPRTETTIRVWRLAAPAGGAER